MAVLFSGDFETGDLSQFDPPQQFAAGRAKCVSGDRSSNGGPSSARWGSFYFESEVHSGDDVLGGERCEILKGGFNQGVTGTDQWFSWSFWIPTSLPVSTKTGLIGGQHHHSYDFIQSDQFGVSPNQAALPFGSVSDPHFWYGVSGGPQTPNGQEVNGTFSKAFDIASLSLFQGAWIDVLLHMIWQDTTTGTVELWLKKATDSSFTKYVSRLGDIANKVTGATTYMKLGQNRIEDSGLGVGFCWYDNFLIGDVRTDVDIFGGSVDTTAPVFSSANVIGKTITLTYNETLSPLNIPAVSNYTITVNGSSIGAPAYIQISNTNVIITLNQWIQPTDVVTFNYTTGALRDVTGNISTSLTSTPITNQSTIFKRSSVARLIAPNERVIGGIRTINTGGGGV